ncbi:MAG: acetamidase/formamidase family protein [Chloroflexota bacterium]
MSQPKRISRDQKITNFSRNHQPVMEIGTNEELIVECPNGSLIATGPIYVNGAEPGDALVVHIGEMKFGNEAEMRLRPHKGVFGDYLAEKYDTVQRPRFPIVDNRVIFNDQISIPPQYMVGLVGTTPHNQEIPVSWPGRHGGNLDNKLIAPGATLYLPIYLPGALVAAGDLHFCMGDGEVMLTAMEVTGEVSLKFDLMKGRKLKWPIVETDRLLCTMGIARTLDQAMMVALEEMKELLQLRVGLTLEEAGMLMSAMCDLAICEVVSPQVVVRATMDKTVVKALRV